MNTKEIILSYLSPGLAAQLAPIGTADFEKMTELRIRVDKPILLYQKNHEQSIGRFRPTPSDIAETIERISQYSLYALEEELRMGYITLPGGHRVGITGKVVAENRAVRTIRPINGLNIRVSRAIHGCADMVLPQLFETSSSGGKRLPYNTMIISPPGCGKTTMLRDIIRQFSDGIPGLCPGITVGVVDERSEIGGSYRGVAQNDIGIRTDLLDSCPKDEGMVLLLRAMAPNVIAVDELGGERDARAVEDVSNAGVRLLCTVHGRDLDDIKLKPALRGLLDKGIFKRFVVLRGPGQKAEVLSA